MVSQAARFGLATRAALHTGECEFDPEGQPYGYTIDLTRRMLPVAVPGKVLVSRVVKDLVAGSGIQFSRHAHLAIPNEVEEWPLFEVVSC
jgi:class 3 adenylate cyclase